jgi:short-subunit dehydrogenase
MKDAPGKTALVTGASVGLGRDLCELIARDGHHLIVVARNEQRLNELAESLRKQFGITVDVIAQDLATPGAAKIIFERVGKRTVDYLINNAGFGTHGPFVQADIQSQLDMLQVNIVALTHLTRLFLPGMLARRSGRIMNLASVASFLPGPLMAVYYATKAYVLSFSEAIAGEIAGSGVTVTAMCPGPTKTEFQVRAGIEDSPLFRGRVMDSMTACRIGYAAMLRGRRVVVTGLSNKLSVLGMKFLPRALTAAMARKLNENR